MILIADSGSTKTQWHILHSGKPDFLTQGINPYYQTEDEIFTLLKNELPTIKEEINEIYFFGAGCNDPLKNRQISNALLQIFPNSSINIDTDLLATCLATSKAKEAICCILGTGSNSCYFNGNKITDNISPLGYILGDEGSGAHIGKTFINRLYKRHFSLSLENAFKEQFKLSRIDVLNKVYQQELPNRFLASLCPFIKKQSHQKEIYNMVVDCFDEFIQKNVLQYDNTRDRIIHFTGSIAFHFKEELLDAIGRNHLTPGEIIKEPMEGLIDYFKQKNL
ncbi:ATPase [Labilibacter sediminis]|nr:ATPase [Labilibacter sediminis]